MNVGETSSPQLQQISLGSVWNVPLQTHGSVEPITQAAMWRSVAHQRNVPSSFPLEQQFCSLCPLSSRNKQGNFALHSVGASSKSRLAVWFHFSSGRCPGAAVRRRPNTGQVMPLNCTVALLSLLFSAANLAGNGPILHQPAAFRGRCPQLPCMDAEGVLSIQRMSPSPMIR